LFSITALTTVVEYEVQVSLEGKIIMGYSVIVTMYSHVLKCFIQDFQICKKYYEIVAISIS